MRTSLSGFDAEHALSVGPSGTAAGPEGLEHPGWQAEAEALTARRNDHIVRIHQAAATGGGSVLVVNYLPGWDAERRWLPAGGSAGDVI